MDQKYILFTKENNNEFDGNDNLCITNGIFLEEKELDTRKGLFSLFNNIEWTSIWTTTTITDCSSLVEKTYALFEENHLFVVDLNKPYTNSCLSLDNNKFPKMVLLNK